MKSRVNISAFRVDNRRSNEEDGKVYVYSFPVLFYKKIPLVYANIYYCQNNNNKLELEVTSGNNLYPLWYASGEWGENTVVEEIAHTINCKLVNTIVAPGYKPVWITNTLIGVEKKDGERSNYCR